MVKTEAQTRSEIIDKLLEESGWNVKDPMQVIEEFDILTALPHGVAEPRSRYDGHQFSDYVLLGKNGKPLAVIEAKKTSKDAAIGREQAKQYCLNIQKHERREKGSISAPLTMINTPWIALMDADYHLAEFEDQFPDAGKLIVSGRNK